MLFQHMDDIILEVLLFKKNPWQPTAAHETSLCSPVSPCWKPYASISIPTLLLVHFFSNHINACAVSHNWKNDLPFSNKMCISRSPFIIFSQSTAIHVIRPEIESVRSSIVDPITRERPRTFVCCSLFSVESCFVSKIHMKQWIYRRCQYVLRRCNKST